LFLGVVRKDVRATEVPLETVGSLTYFIDHLVLEESENIPSR
jgi:hypothetical protein